MTDGVAVRMTVGAVDVVAAGTSAGLMVGSRVGMYESAELGWGLSCAADGRDEGCAVGLSKHLLPSTKIGNLNTGIKVRSIG